MPTTRPLALRGDVPALTGVVDTILTDLEVPTDFPPEVVEEAVAAARAGAGSQARTDHTGRDFVTIDPPGSQDLDQAFHVERSGSGFTVWYAIADVGAFVRPGSALDLEARRRVETVYLPDRRLPLYPTELSEGAASLLPGVDRPAVVWRLDLDAQGELVRTHAERGLVRSRAQHDYPAVQAAIDDGSTQEVFLLLREVGLLREELERERGGVSLPLPDQEVLVSDTGWSLHLREQLPVEAWNAQISLLTGMAAAQLMLYAEVGLLRTLPPADARGVARLRRTAEALGIDWPQPMDYPDLVRTLRPGVPAHAAMLDACTTLLRGAGYVAFDGAVPDQPLHSAVAAAYAHATAPLRRLGDRYVSEVCLALCADQPVEPELLDVLHELPAVLAAGQRRAAAVERAVLEAVEAAVLAGRVGETFAGVVVDVDDKDPHRGVVVLAEPPVESVVRAQVPLPLGHRVTVRLVEADGASSSVAFELVSTD
jgi:exoribonuclease R